MPKKITIHLSDAQYAGLEDLCNIDTVPVPKPGGKRGELVPAPRFTPEERLQDVVVSLIDPYVKVASQSLVDQKRAELQAAIEAAAAEKVSGVAVSISDAEAIPDAPAVEAEASPVERKSRVK